jgi:hypothetical protein
MKRNESKRLIPLEKVGLFADVQNFMEHNGATAFLMSGSLLGKEVIKR